MSGSNTDYGNCCYRDPGQASCQFQEEATERIEGRAYCEFHVPADAKRGWPQLRGEKLAWRISELCEQTPAGETINLRGVVLPPESFELSGAHLSSVDADYAEFLGPVGFRRATFLGASFKRCRFYGDVDFQESVFRDYANFDQAAFAGAASFARSRFSAAANFDRVVFGQGVRFTEASFRADANFQQTGFTGSAAFTDAYFGRDAHFTEARFGAKALFRNAVFCGFALFNGAQFSRIVSFEDAQFRGHSTFEGTTFVGSTCALRTPEHVRVLDG